MEREHQQYAAKCRHAIAINAKQDFYRELAILFENYPVGATYKDRIVKFASSTSRHKIPKYKSRLGFKESTLRTWLREWKAQALSTI